MTTIIDCGMGNLQSLKNAFQFLGEKVKVANQGTDIEKAERLVFPGVGHFGKAMESLKRNNLTFSIVRSIEKKVPFLGICLGLQLLFEESQEASRVKGLAVLRGNILKFPGLRVPHMGWNQISIKKPEKIFKGVKDNSFVYFMHSFYVNPSDSAVMVAQTDYGINFCSAVEMKNVFGVQFHPEKSGEVGLKILKNFMAI